MLSDTIFALSSGRLPAGVGVIRISGPRSRFVCETMAGTIPRPRVASLRSLRSAEGSLLDNGLVFWYPAPGSFTGEDCVEFHTHGGVAVVRAVMETLENIENVRHAEPGEFTRRAFVNGKFDLIQAEALSDLISADTEAQRRFAVQNVNGRQSDLYDGWRRRLVFARAALEAELDFSDERDVPEAISQSIWDDLKELSIEMDAHCRDYRQAEIIRDGFDVVLAGAPNAGKSSLLNALAKRDVAIVSPEAGTTRDLIEVNLDMNGYKVRVTDTAGLRETAHLVERIGVERARARMTEADLVLFLIDLTSPDTSALVSDSENVDVIRIGTKADLAPLYQACGIDVVISTVDGRGIPELLQVIARRVEASAASASDVLPSQLRHVSVVNAARRSIDDAIHGPQALELQAEALRRSSSALAEIAGGTGVEDVLDSIFSRFCIGK